MSHDSLTPRTADKALDPMRNASWLNELIATLGVLLVGKSGAATTGDHDWYPLLHEQSEVTRHELESRSDGAPGPDLTFGVPGQAHRGPAARDSLSSRTRSQAGIPACAYMSRAKSAHHPPGKAYFAEKVPMYTQRC